MKRYEDPKWVQSMKLSLDHNYAMAEFLGESGLKETDLQGLAPRLGAFHQDLAARRESGQLGFMELPYQAQVVKEVRQVAKPLLEWCWDLVVLGIGGSALGARALHQALCHPQHNKFPMARRHLKLGLWVADNIDPDSCTACWMAWICGAPPSMSSANQAIPPKPWPSSCGYTNC